MISQANLQQGQPYGYQVLRTGAQPTAEATTVPAEPTTAVAPEASTALTAPSADAYTSSTALATATPEEGKKKPVNWVAWTLAGAGILTAAFLGGKALSGNTPKVGEAVAEAAPKVGEALADAGKQVAKAADETVQKAKSAVAELFGTNIQNHSADDIIALTKQHREQGFTRIRQLGETVNQYHVGEQVGKVELTDAQLTKVRNADLSSAFAGTNGKLIGGANKPAHQIMDGATKVTEFTSVKMDPESAELFNRLRKSNDALGKAQYGRGRFELVSVTPKGAATYKFVVPEPYTRREQAILAAFKSEAGDPKGAISKAKAVARGLYGKNADVTLSNGTLTITRLGVDDVVIPGRSSLNSSTVHLYDESGKLLIDRDKGFFANGLTSTNSKTKEAFENRFGANPELTVLVPQRGNTPAIIQIGGGKVSETDTHF
jgi:hypothetical protein